MAGIAVMIGTVAATGLTRLLADLLFEVSPTDPVTFVTMAVVVALVGVAASWIPARRATRIDPALTIRESEPAVSLTRAGRRGYPTRRCGRRRYARI